MDTAKGGAEEASHEGFVTDQRRPQEHQNLPVSSSAPHAQSSSSFHKQSSVGQSPPKLPAETDAPKKHARWEVPVAARGSGLGPCFVVCAQYSQALTILPGPWEGPGECPWWDMGPGPLLPRLWLPRPSVSPEAEVQPQVLPLKCDPHVLVLCLVLVLPSAASGGGTTRTLISYCQ